jgi:hypothetical protein
MKLRKSVRIAAIAFQVGFNAISAFTTVKKQTGYAPSGIDNRQNGKLKRLQRKLKRDNCRLKRYVRSFSLRSFVSSKAVLVYAVVQFTAYPLAMHATVGVFILSKVSIIRPILCFLPSPTGDAKKHD